MQIAHVISDLVLAATGLFVFFKYLIKLNFTSTILWESFVLSVVGSAIFGAINFAGFEKAAIASEFFQKLATITGGIGLVGATYSLVSGRDLPKLGLYVILTLGFFLFALSEGFGIYKIGKIVPIVAMSLVVVLALFAFGKKNLKVGTWLLFGVVFFALGTFRKKVFGDNELSIDIFHYITACGLLCLGMANSQKTA